MQKFESTSVVGEKYEYNQNTVCVNTKRTVRVKGKENLSLEYLSSYIQEIAKYVLFIFSLKHKSVQNSLSTLMWRRINKQKTGSEVAKMQKEVLLVYKSQLEQENIKF